MGKRIKGTRKFNGSVIKIAKLLAYGFVSIFYVFSKTVEKADSFGSGGRSDYNIGTPQPTTRPESYRKMKRRNRLIRKFDHKSDQEE